MVDLIYVVARPSVGERIALSERHPDHPLNEYGEHDVYVAKGTGPVQVAETSEVMRLLAPTNGTLLRIEGAVLAEAKTLHDAELDMRRQRREQLLLEQRQAKADEIGDANTRVQELTLKIAELEAKMAGTLAVADATAAADRARAQSDAALDAAEAAKTRSEATTSTSGAAPAKGRAASAPIADPVNVPPPPVSTHLGAADAALTAAEHERR